MDHLFGWLPIRDVITIVFFCISMGFFITNKRIKNTNIWIIGLSLWAIGMVFDALRRIEGWGVLRIVEHSFQLAGSTVIVYTAYKTYKKKEEVEK